MDPSVGIEFRIGRSEHLVVEKALTADPEGIAGILVDAPFIDRHEVVIEAARRAGRNVAVETLTERLVAPGYELKGLQYARQLPIDTSQLTSLSARADLVERVVSVQSDIATVLVPPHFYSTDLAEVGLNAALAGITIQQYAGRQVRAVLAGRRSFLTQPDVTDFVADSYERAGVSWVDLRLSPMGGEKDGPQKIRSALAMLAKLKSRGFTITLGFQATLGHTAFAMDLVSGFSVGVGYREHYDHNAELTRQRNISRIGQTGKLRGPQAGVFLPGADVTVPIAVGRALYRNQDIRTSLVCGVAKCAERIDMPAVDPRQHYMHSQTRILQTALARPARWRPTLERDRLQRALDLRQVVNDQHLPKDSHAIQTRTVESLLSELAASTDRAASA